MSVKGGKGVVMDGCCGWVEEEATVQIIVIIIIIIK